MPLVAGYVELNDGPSRPLPNAAAGLEHGNPIRKVFKSRLPTCDVFDEARYFESARTVAPVEIAGKRIGITICEDIWTEDYLPRRPCGSSPVDDLLAQGAELIVSLSGAFPTQKSFLTFQEQFSEIFAGQPTE